MRYGSQSHSMYRANVPNQIYIPAITKNIGKVLVLFLLLIWWSKQQFKNKQTNPKLHKIEIKYGNIHSFYSDTITLYLSSASLVKERLQVFLYGRAALKEIKDSYCALSVVVAVSPGTNRKHYFQSNLRNVSKAWNSYFMGYLLYNFRISELQEKNWSSEFHIMLTFHQDFQS